MTPELPALIDPLTGAEIPPILYKYRDSNNKDHLDILQNKRLWFPSPKSFNDPFDCKIPLNFREFADKPALAEKYAQDIIDKYPYLKADLGNNVSPAKIIQSNLIKLDWLIQHEKDLVDQLNKDISIFCLSEEFNDILLWSHYGNCHKGFCLGIDYEKLVASSTFATGGPVHYTNIYPIISPSTYGTDQIYIQTFYKSLHWSYEKEYRLLKMKESNIYVDINPDVIKSIYLGLEIEKAQKDIILDLCKKNFPNVEIYQMTKDNKKFALKHDRI